MNFKCHKIIIKKLVNGNRSYEYLSYNEYQDILLSNAFIESLYNIALIKDNCNSSPIHWDKRFTVNNIYYDSHNIIFANLVQEFDLNLKKFNDTNSKYETNLSDETANEDQYFYINIKKGYVYIQNKRFTPKSSLNMNVSAVRIAYILSSLLSQDNDIYIELIPHEFDYPIEYFKNKLTDDKCKVNQIKFSNLLNKKIAPNSVLHNPRADLDQAVSESWNEYESKTIDSIELKAHKDRSIHKLPLANLGIEIASQNEDSERKVSANMTYSVGDNKYSVKSNKNMLKPIHINKHYSTQDIFDAIINEEEFS